MNDSDVGYVEMISQYLIKSCILIMTTTVTMNLENKRVRH